LSTIDSPIKFKPPPIMSPPNINMNTNSNSNNMQMMVPQINTTVLNSPSISKTFIYVIYLGDKMSDVR